MRTPAHLQLIEVDIKLLEAFKQRNEFRGSFGVRHGSSRLNHALLIEQGLEPQRKLQCASANKTANNQESKSVPHPPSADKRR